MLTKNLDVASGLVNGARGVVTKFISGDQGGVYTCLSNLYLYQ